MAWLTAVELLAVSLLLGWLVSIAFRIVDHLNRVIRLLELIERQLAPGAGVHSDRMHLTNYCTWQFSSGMWRLIEKRLEPNFVSGDPPRRPGSYEGETIHRPATRQQLP